MNKYLDFREVDNAPKKTRRVLIVSKIGSIPLGEIKFHGAWRQYTFLPENETIFDIKCLNEITEKINEMNQEIRQEWKKRKENKEKS